jgi:hypothetical protein
MSKIIVERNPDAARLAELGVEAWPIWEKEASDFPWFYDAEETCYLLEGEVLITPAGDDDVHIQAGDLVTFPEGLACYWSISKPVRKHYRFD